MRRRIPRFRPLFAVLAAACLLSCCQVANPASRIEENPVLFASLPAEDKLLVQRGQIRSGMSPEAVYLAWGYPHSRPSIGEQNGKRMERWVYTRLEPVMVSPAFGVGPCWGPHGWHHCHYHGMMNTAYVPRQAASVLFEDGRVVSWEARR